jgi:DNA-binding YbaB/EbfC family protein
MKNLSEMMKQAQAMQQRMAEMQESLAALEVDGTSGGGLVTITLSGKGDLRRVKIDPSLVDPAEAEVLEDLIVAAHNDAKAKLEMRLQEEMQKITGGMPLPPGFKFPL